ncbi:MAG: prolyl aminopeptidase [bacterium]|nr:prolyl aminopeptidase [bacterium]
MDRHINNRGHLDVGDGHKIYFEDWGNPKASPSFYLHGGPGGHFSDSSKLLFDPTKHRVIFHDQRGCGQSTPYAKTENNTSQHLIRDIEKLRTHLGIENMNVIGGSWGSTLSLLYTISHPERVKRLIMWGVYLIRQFETDYVNEGYPRHTFPEAWSRFIALVPKEHRKNGDSIMKYYAGMIRSKDPKVAKLHADEWTLWEYTLCSIDYDLRRFEADVMEEDNTSVALFETHYFLNKCFVPENYILDTIHKIKHIPCSVIQGRFDFCTPPIAAYDLAQAYGKNLNLQFTNAGHMRTEPENFAALRATILATC